MLNPCEQHDQVLGWLRSRVSIFPYFQHFMGSFKGIPYDSDRLPLVRFKNKVTCKPFREFVQTALLDRLQTGAITVVGKVCVVHPPFLVMPLTVEPTKPRLCYDARYLNLWMKDQPFKLDQLREVSRYIAKDTYQTVLDDKSGDHHILFNDESCTFFGFEWEGWYFTCNTLLFGWKISSQSLFSLTWNPLFPVY